MKAARRRLQSGLSSILQLGFPGLQVFEPGSCETGDIAYNRCQHNTIATNQALTHFSTAVENVLGADVRFKHKQSQSLKQRCNGKETRKTIQPLLR